ncbi:cupin domain-containing protein [uncultured Herbaspirillum sp.]|uniref:JmjC domain-containing protein n=1 Tax=uncultured Herbaspirillum sp. TaxID=160236 RepID=UPI00262F82DB|nr:cupin domain-containing protein [uncultured Herbaspirillum sp.]
MFNFSIGKDEFLSQFYEQDIYLERQAFEPELNWQHINEVLHAMQPMCSYTRLHDGTKVIPQTEYTEPHLHVGLHSHRFIQQALYKHLSAGSTLIIDRMEIFSPKIKQYCDFLSGFTDQPVVANGYAAFGEKESFGNHWDTHDVFAVQLIGRKRWKVYAPTYLLPMPDQTSRARKQDCPSEPILDTYLNAGDILYVPRGWWHTAIPGNEETFHIAAGVHPARLAHYATWICQSMLTEHLSARQSLSDHKNERQHLEEMADCLKHLLLDQDNLHGFKRTLREYNHVKPEFNLPEAVTSS